MAYVTIPKDLNNVKTKFIGNFTKRQCVCFGIGIIIALPIFFLVKKATNDTTMAFYVFIGCLIPFFLLGMVEKNGMPLEQYMKYFLLHKLRKPIRRMKVENIYEDYARQYEIEQKGANDNGSNNRKTG